MSKSAKTNNVTAAMYDTLVRPVITEKSMLSSEAGKVTFLVPLSASKEDVKAAVEAIFNVKVNKVNTIRQFAESVADTNANCASSTSNVINSMLRQRLRELNMTRTVPLSLL